MQNARKIYIFKTCLIKINTNLCSNEILSLSIKLTIFFLILIPVLVKVGQRNVNISYTYHGGS